MADIEGLRASARRLHAHYDVEPEIVVADGARSSAT
jgi:hypothetical protein